MKMSKKIRINFINSDVQTLQTTQALQWTTKSVCQCGIFRFFFVPDPCLNKRSDPDQVKDIKTQNPFEIWFFFYDFFFLDQS